MGSVRGTEAPWQAALESARANLRQAERSLEASRRRRAGAAARESHRRQASAHLDVAAFHMQRAAAAGASVDEIQRGSGWPDRSAVAAVLRDGASLRLAAGGDLPDVGSWREGRFVGPEWPGVSPPEREARPG
jgi:hypothetical protein